MNCSKVQNLLSAYMDSELAGEEQLQIRSHMRDCPACSAEHESLLTTKRMISSLSVRQPHADLEQMILEALAEEEQGRARRSPVIAWWLTIPINRRVQHAGAFAVAAIAFAAIRIAPVLMSSPRQPATLSLASQNVSLPVNGEQSPMQDVSFIFNPNENAPINSSGSTAMPVSVTEPARPQRR